MLRQVTSTLKHARSNLPLQSFIPSCPFSSSSPPSSETWRQVVATFQRKANDPTASFHATEIANIIHMCTENQRPREAMDVLYKAEKYGIRVSLASFVQIACSWARKGQSARALAMMSEVPKRFRGAFQAHPFKPRASGYYDPLLSVFEKQQDWRSTHHAMTQMHALGLAPPLRAFRALMLTLAKARRKDTLVATISFVEKQFSNLWTDGTTLIAMCQALASVNEHERIVEIYHKLHGEYKIMQETASTVLWNQFLLAAVRLETTPTKDRDRTLYKLYEATESDQANKRMLAKPSKALHRKFKQDLAVVLKQVRTINLGNISHASTLIDTLDEYELWTAAREVFHRLVEEGRLKTTPWRRHDGFEIDLHTFSRGVAKCAVVAAFEDLARTGHASFARGAPRPTLRIITGVGKRSRTYMKPVLRQEITDLLTKWSRPPLWPSVHPTNPGVLLVREHALRNWLEKRGQIRYF
ncbi:hypothetical protein PsorP6_000600 [Peronosclerospora sorghi]|uniref:Uncharacterized protein n=1 Tax=Peronosclerospora sorghi TaxID=230839 RepID=A0ACC0WWI2_9STRA|nr:hypothetical protein PsorP6_000600 [Peronosclerospora sorghi]